MPKEPEISVCSPILVRDEKDMIDLTRSYAFCVSDKNPNDKTKQYEMPLEKFLVLKPVMTSGVDYAKKVQWGRDLKKWGNQNCGKNGFME